MYDNFLIFSLNLQKKQVFTTFEKKIMNSLYHNVTIALIPLLLPFFELTQNKYVGVWQAPNKAVWIDIRSDNSVFQCRIDYDKTVFSSKGILKGDTIYWEKIWVKDLIERRGNKITLDGRYGKFTYEKAKNKMRQICFPSA